MELGGVFLVFVDWYSEKVMLNLVSLWRRMFCFSLNVCMFFLGILLILVVCDFLVNFRYWFIKLYSVYWILLMVLNIMGILVRVFSGFGMVVGV